MVNKSAFQGLIRFPWSTAFQMCQIVSVEALHGASPSPDSSRILAVLLYSSNLTSSSKQVSK